MKLLLILIFFLNLVASVAQTSTRCSEAAKYQDAFHQFLETVDLQSFEVPKDRQLQDHIVWFKDGVNKLKGKLLGKKGHSLYFIVQQRLPNKSGFRLKIISEKMSDLELSSLLPERPKAVIKTKPLIFQTKGQTYEAQIIAVTQNLVKIKDFTTKKQISIKKQDIDSMQLIGAMAVYLTPNKNAQIKNKSFQNAPPIRGKIINDSGPALWILTGKAKDYSDLALLKISHTDYHLSNIQFTSPAPYNRINQHTPIGPRLPRLNNLASKFKENLNQIEKAIYKHLGGLPLIFQPKHRIVRRYFYIDGINAKNHPLLRLSVNNKVEIGADLKSTNRNTRNGRIHTGDNPRDLEEGIYNYVVVKQGKNVELITGLVQSSHTRFSATYGLHHQNLANGRPVIIAGELQIKKNATYRFNTSDNSFVSSMVRHQRVSEERYNQAAGNFFHALFGYKGSHSGYRTRKVGQRIVTEQISLATDTLSIAELKDLVDLSSFRSLNPDVANLVLRSY